MHMSGEGAVERRPLLLARCAVRAGGPPITTEDPDRLAGVFCRFVLPVSLAGEERPVEVSFRIYRGTFSPQSITPLSR